MKLIVVVALALVVVAAALPVQDAPVAILRSSNEQTPDGGYNYSFETENGISAQASGEVKSVIDEENKPHDVVVVRGQYSYPDKDGQLITITYVADEFGFKAEGPSIPIPV